MKVEVNLEDLEIIIHATSAIKQIETALSSRKHDPFVKPYLQYNEAHNNLVYAMNAARRSGSGAATDWDGELSDNEFKLLKNFSRTPVLEVSGFERQQTKEIDTLLSKGCIKMGQCVVGAVWAGETKADLKPTDDFVIAITQRGKDKLEKLRSEAA